MNVDLLIKENKELSDEKQRYKDMWFTANNALAKYKQLEEQVGCSLEVLYKIKEGKQIYIDTYIVQRPSGANMTIIKRMYNVIGIDMLNNQIQCLAQFSDCDMEFYVPIYDYKKTWWLKEDRSE